MNVVVIVVDDDDDDDGGGGEDGGEDGGDDDDGYGDDDDDDVHIMTRQQPWYVFLLPKLVIVPKLISAIVNSLFAFSKTPFYNLYVIGQ